MPLKELISPILIGACASTGRPIASASRIASATRPRVFVMATLLSSGAGDLRVDAPLDVGDVRAHDLARALAVPGLPGLEQRVMRRFALRAIDVTEQATRGDHLGLEIHERMDGDGV